MTSSTTVRLAKAVLDKVAIRDEVGISHPRGCVVEVQPGRIVFYRDVTPEVLIREHNGWAIEAGVLAYLREREVDRVHYRVVDGPLYAATVETIETEGVEYDRNNRHQFVLPLTKWTRYAADVAYAVPQSDRPWRVIDHRTGADEDAEPDEERIDREMAEAIAAFDARGHAAKLALARLRTATESADVVAAMHPFVRDLVWIADWLMAREEERVAREADGR